MYFILSNVLLGNVIIVFDWLILMFIEKIEMIGIWLVEVCWVFEIFKDEYFVSYKEYFYWIDWFVIILIFVFWSDINCIG